MISAPTVGNGLDRSEKKKKAEAYSRPALIQFIETGAHTGAPLQRFLTYSKIVGNGLDRSEKKKKAEAYSRPAFTFIIFL